MSKPFDVIVFGASGFTGRLVAEYLNATYGVGGELNWAMAGRNVGKLGQVRDLIGAPKALPLIVANAADAASLESIVRSMRAIITTVGPYQLHGEPLLAASANEGTDYVELCGEPAGSPSTTPGPAGHCRGDAARPRARRGDGRSVCADARLQWAGAAQGRCRALRRGRQVLGRPFIMAAINTKNVHRTNALTGHAYGRDFVYDEMMLTGDVARGEKRAKAMVRTARIQTALLGFAPTRALLRRFALPKPSQGPDKQARETGHYDLLFIGEAPDGRTLHVSVKGEATETRATVPPAR